MKTTEIADAVQELTEAPFAADEFAFEFLRAFGADDVTIKRLQSGNSNKSDLENAVLPGGKTKLKVHILTAQNGNVDAAMEQLQNSPATTKHKARFLLATDGQTLQAIDLQGGADDVLACTYAEFADRFAFFFPMVGISLTDEIKDSAIDIKATGRLDKLYVALLQDERNADWAEEPGRARFNHFMAQLIFCFYAEDTSIFYCPGVELTGERPKGYAGYFTTTLKEKTEGPDAPPLKTIMEIVFGTMALDTRDDSRSKADVPLWADRFPYVNGGLFEGEPNVPHFSRMARTYLIRAGELRWTDINPDIFGSMIQAVADGDERANLGMHYTSVPNILKVLNPLFLDDLNAQLERAANNKQQLGKLKKRLAGIRVFDPACGSGNFLVIAYKRMREIEHKANIAAGWGPMSSVIPTNNFRGIEIKSFAAEVARLALIIAEYQCNAIYLDQMQADALFLPLDKRNWITCGNALRLDWLDVCPPPGETKVKLTSDDLFDTPLDQSEIDFENEGGEVFICGNPPYLGSSLQNKDQKKEVKEIVQDFTKKSGSLDYVSGWIAKAVKFIANSDAIASLVVTNSVFQGQHVSALWPIVEAHEVDLLFASGAYKWSNLATDNAGVTVVTFGLSAKSRQPRLLEYNNDGSVIYREVPKISPYLTAGDGQVVHPTRTPIKDKPLMDFGNKSDSAGAIILSFEERLADIQTNSAADSHLRGLVGSHEAIHSKPRYCYWIPDRQLSEASQVDIIADRIEAVRRKRLASRDKYARSLAKKAHQFKGMREAENVVMVIPRHSSENRPYLPIDALGPYWTIADSAFALYDAPLWNLALIASKLHLVWIATVCGKLKTDYRYSNTLGWNTFPVPTLTEADKAELTVAAENILLARESYFPATIADMYDPKRMDKEFPAVREAHNANDAILEDIYKGRPFRNDTERLETLFEMYVEMTEKAGAT